MRTHIARVPCAFASLQSTAVEGSLTERHCAGTSTLLRPLAKQTNIVEETVFINS